MTDCPVCGAKVQAGDQFCHECGAAYLPNRNDPSADLIARIRSRGEAAETDELAKIDYLLEALEQAQARRELSDSAYLLLTRRYLNRARELGLEPFEEAEAIPAAASSETAARPTPARPAPQPAWSPPPRAPRPPSRIAVAARSVPWTVWVALAGALLVVAAAAGFAIYAWPSLPKGIRLGILVAVTAAFYGGGLWLRRRLAVIGISLLAIGAALVLVDGWALLSVAGLHSLWWWTLLFAVGSAVHWGMGVWLQAKLFDVSGAIAQIAWWWLLGTALSWPLGAQAAILTTVGLIWTLAAHRVRRGAAGSIGQVLGLAGPGLAAGASVVAIVGVLVDPGWSAVIAALVVAVTATAALELQRVVDGAWVREASVVTLLPVIAAFLALPTTGPVWPAIVLMVVAGIVCLFTSAWRGGTLRAAVGLLTLLAAPSMPGILGHGGAGPWIGAVASWLGIGTLAVAAGSLLPRMALRRFERGISDTCRVMHIGGWLVLLGASVLQIVALGPPEPLMAGELPSSGALTMLAAEAAAAWLVSTAVRSRVERSAAAAVAKPIVVLLTGTGLVGYAYSQFAATLAVHWIRPDAGHVWYSFVMLGLAAAWSHARTLSMRRLTYMSSRVAAWMFGLSSVGSVVFSIAPALVRSDIPGVGYVLLAALAAALWGLEAWRFRERVFVAAASIASSATIYLAAWKTGGRAAADLEAWTFGGRTAAGLATAIAALVLLPLPALLRRGEARSRTWWTAPCLLAGLAATATLVHRPPLQTAGLLALAIAAAAAHLAERPRSPYESLPRNHASWAIWPADAGATCAALAVVTVLFQIGHRPGLMELGLVWAVALVGSFVCEIWARIRGRLALETAAFVLVPLLVWALVAVGRDAPDWTAAAGLGSAFPILAFAWWRGGHARVVVGGALLAVELPSVIVHAFGASDLNGLDVILGTELLLGLCCLFVSLWVRTAIGPESRWRGAHDLRRVFGAEAWLLMAGAAVGAVAAAELSFGNPEWTTSALVLWCLTLVAWLIAAAARWRVESRRRVPRESSAPGLARDAAPAIVVYALSLYLARVIERWALPNTHLAWITVVIFVVGLIWSHLRRPVRRLLGCPEPVVEVMWVLTSFFLAALVLVTAVSGHSAPGLASGTVLALAGLAWCVETARFGRPHYMPAASAALAAAAGLFVWGASSRAGGLAAAVAGAVLALVPLALRRKAKWRLSWALGAAVAAAVGVIGAFFAPWSATLALAALAAALAGPALLGLPVLAGPSAFVAFAAVCSLESWAGANAWAGTAVAIVAAAAMLAPAVLRRSRPQPMAGATWSLALAGALGLASVLVATTVATFESAPPAWLSGGDWSLAVLLCALAAYCAGWSLSAHTKWGLVVGPVFLLAGLLMFLGAADVRVPEAYFTVVAVWCVVVAWRLSYRERYRRAAMAVDIVALTVGLGGPVVLMMASGLGDSSTDHAIWLIGLAAAIVGSGVGLRVSLYFGCGLGGVVLAAFWLTSSHLSAIPAVVAIVAIVGGALIALGAVGERRRARLTLVAKNAFAGWR